MCAIVYFDAIWANVGDEGLVRNKAEHLVISMTCTGRKAVLGMWLLQYAGADAWPLVALAGGRLGAHIGRHGWRLMKGLQADNA